MTTIASDPFAEVKDAPQLPHGLHYDVAFPVYAAQRALNAGALKWSAVSMAHVKAAFDGRIAGSDSEARKFGRMVHVRLLESDKWSTSDIATPCCGVLKSGDRKGERCGLASQATVDGDWFCGRHAPKVAYWPTDFVSEADAARIECMAAAIDMSRLPPGRTEVTMIATLDGVRCKGRADLLCDGFVYDIKKCQVGECLPDTIEKSILSYGWHMQAALYSRLASALTGRPHRFVWLFIEDGEPYSVVEMEADSETMAIGNFEIDQTLRRWRQSIDRGEFFGPQGRPGGLPLWYREQFADSQFTVST